MAKLRKTRARRQPITEAAVAAYEAAGPSSVEVQGQAALICDDALAGALGVPALVWLAGGVELVERLIEAAEGRSGPSP